MKVALRPPELEDADAICAALRHRETVQWLSSVPWPYRREDAVEFILHHATPRDLAITVDGAFAGMIRSHDELGYWLAPEFRGKGIALRAGRIALRPVFAGGPGAETACHFTGNAPSRAVLERLGFTEIGTRRATRRMDGAELEQRLMRATAESFAASLSIRTSRCMLTPMNDADLPALHGIATAPATARMLLRFFPGQTEAEFARIMRPAMDPLHRPVRLAVRRDGRCIGSIGVDEGADPAVFYFLASDMAGQGIASEILPPFCAAMREWYGLGALTAEVFADNPASRRVLEKAGFRITETRLLLSAGRKAPGQGMEMRSDP